MLTLVSETLEFLDDFEEDKKKLRFIPKRKKYTFDINPLDFEIKLDMDNIKDSKKNDNEIINIKYGGETENELF